MRLTLISRLISLLLLSVSLTGAFYFPVMKWWLVAAIALYFFILVRFPLGWLFFLPALLPVLNLAPWSGWVLIEEFDFFILATVAMGFWKKIYFDPRSYKIKQSSVFVLLFFLISLLSSLWLGLLPLQPFRPDSVSNYLTPYNSIRIARSFLWVLMLLPILHFQIVSSRQVVLRNLFMGFVAASLGLGVIVFWERGVIWDLLHATNRYQALASLLDFSSEYRITALFSEMHTGGSAIDGFSALAWLYPVGAFISFWQEKKKNDFSFGAIVKSIVFVVASFFAIYVIATTFTRITYLAFGTSALLLVAGFFWSPRVSGKRRFLVICGIVVIGIFFFAWLLLQIYHMGGYISLASGLIVLACGLLVGAASDRIPSPSILLVVGVLVLLGMGGGISQHDRWL